MTNCIVLQLVVVKNIIVTNIFLLLQHVKDDL